MKELNIWERNNWWPSQGTLCQAYHTNKETAQMSKDSENFLIALPWLASFTALFAHTHLTNQGPAESTTIFDVPKLQDRRWEKLQRRGIKKPSEMKQLASQTSLASRSQTAVAGRRVHFFFRTQNNCSCHCCWWTADLFCHPKVLKSTGLTCLLPLS